MVYSKKEAKMTQGFAILCMLVLHLFCRKGDDVLGFPLIWLNEDTPLVYVFGFFAEICVIIYSICAGYAQYVMYLQNKLTYRSNLKRVLKLMIKYWIVLALFSLIAIIRGSECGLSVTPSNFVQNVFLLGSYNGAWWFLHTYVYLMLIPPIVLLAIPKRINPCLGMAFCIVFSMGWSLAGKLGLLSWITALTKHPIFIVSYISTEISNIIGVLPWFFIGALLCKGNYIKKISLNYSCTSGTASANGCALSDINITDTLQRFPPKKGALLPWVIVFL